MLLEDGGAGAGIGGNGGKGGDTIKTKGGTQGNPGEDCGIININNSVKVKAYGGRGGSGGDLDGYDDTNPGGGAGGGGFPAAGIGGGGAGGTSGDTNNAGSGFCGGIQEWVVGLGGRNGETIKTITRVQQKNSGIPGSYYETYLVSPYVEGNDVLYNYSTTLQSGRRACGGIGGGACDGYVSNYVRPRDIIPDCARGGKGGTITLSENAVVEVYNGSYITEGEYDRENDQALIYAQAGYDVKAIRELQKVRAVSSRTINALVNEWSQTDYDFTAQRTIKSPYDSTCGSLANTYVLGIGSGAGGSQEVDGNGTYTVDSSMN